MLESTNENFLCRHGQTTGDIEDRFGGAYDDHLTDLGKTQAEDLAQKLQEKKIERIFSSPKFRATETAEIMAKTLKCEIEIVSGLRERNLNGPLTGMIRSEAREKFPELVERLKDYKIAIEGAEDYDSFSIRVRHAFLDITKRNYKVVAIVTHGIPIRVILGDIKRATDYKIGDGAFAELDTNNGILEIVSLNGIILKEANEKK